MKQITSLQHTELHSVANRTVSPNPMQGQTDTRAKGVSAVVNPLENIGKFEVIPKATAFIIASILQEILTTQVVIKNQSDNILALLRPDIFNTKRSASIYSTAQVDSGGGKGEGGVDGVGGSTSGGGGCGQEMI